MAEQPANTGSYFSAANLSELLKGEPRVPVEETPQETPQPEATDEQPVEAPEGEVETEEVEEIVDDLAAVPDKFKNKDGTVDWDKFTKSYKELEKLSSTKSKNEKELEALKEHNKQLYEYSQNLYNNVRQMNAQQQQQLQQQYVQQQQLNPQQQQALLKSLEENPAGTLAAMLDQIVQFRLGPVVQQAQKQTAEYAVQSELQAMAQDTENYPYFEEVKDTMADVIDQIVAERPDLDNNPRLLGYAYKMALGIQAQENRRAQAQRITEEKNQQAAKAKAQQKPKAPFAEGGSAKNSRAGKPTAQESIAEGMLSLNKDKGWFGNH